MDITIAIAKQPKDYMGYEDKPEMPDKKESGNSILDNDWKMECIKQLKEVLDKLKEGDGKEMMEAADHIEMAISVLDNGSDKSEEAMDDEDIEEMESSKESSDDYMSKFQKDSE